MMELGGNIELVGFKELEPAELIILKKIIGSYARKFSDSVEGYEKLVLNLKKAQGKNKFEVDGKLFSSSGQINSEVTHQNLFVTVADVLKKMEKQAVK